MPDEATVAANLQHVNVTVEIEQLTMMPYLAVLTYPRPNLRVARARIRQLSKIGVDRVTFEGRTKIGRLGLVGIGTVGLVVKASGRDGEEYALKIRRTDANRESMAQEFMLTQLANRVQVGAPAYRRSKDFITMRYVKGLDLGDYLRQTRGHGSAARLRRFCHALLNQCRKLDLVGLDHGQLSNLRKHVIVDRDGAPWIIDFESASRKRTPKNVTTAAQYLFVGSKVSPRLRRIVGISETEKIVKALREYKSTMTDESYVLLLSTFGVKI